MRDQATILHVDMDSFYASVEVLENPELAGRPVIVGGRGPRGVVASCNYSARAHGVRSAMPSVRARRLCPDAVFLDGRHDVYAAYSRRIHEVFLAFTPLVEGISLDEAFLDVAGATRLFGPAEQIGHAIRARIASEVGLSCAVGVATSKFLAKLASRAAKPTASRRGPVPGPGVLVVPPGHELEFLHPLPVDTLWGVGPATHRRLARFGVTTVGDLAALPLETLVSALGPAVGRHLHELAWARDDRAVEPEREVKSVGHEETYARDLFDREELHRELVRLADGVAGRLRRAQLTARTVTLKVRFHDFETIARSHTLPDPVDTGPALARAAVALLDRVDTARGVRLLGVSVSNLAPPAGGQLSFDDVAAGARATTAGPARDPAGGPDRRDAEESAALAVDRIRRRFGDAAVGPAALVGEEGLRVKREGDTQWGPKGRPDR